MSSARIDRALALASISTALVLALSAPQARAAETYRVRSLVSDGGVPAAHKDKNLVNGWGIAFGPSAPSGSPTTGPASRPSTTATATTAAAGRHRSRRARRPASCSTAPPASWSARAEVSGPAVHLRRARPASSRGWSPTADPNNAIAAFTAKDGAIYKGLALVTAGGSTAASTRPTSTTARSTSSTSSFRLVKAPGGFTDPNLPNALRAVRHPERRRQAYRHLRQAGRGRGGRRRTGRASASSTCSTPHGICCGAWSRAGALNAPWGIALAPAGFRPVRQRPADRQLRRRPHQRLRPGRPARSAAPSSTTSEPVKIDGLWGITFGNGVATQPADTLFFAAGPGDESHGQYGRIDVVSHH